MNPSVCTKQAHWRRYERYEDRLPNHVLVQRVAQAAGVSTQSVIRAARRRYRKEGKRDRKRLDGCPYTFVSLSLWDDYMQIGSVKRVPTRPEGWLTVKALLAQGLGKRRAYELIHAGELEAVYVGNTLYVNPDAAKRCLLQRRDDKAAPGWTRVSEVYRRAGTSKQALSAYLKRHAIETKKFRHPSRDQLVSYMPEAEAEAYLAGRKGAQKTLGSVKKSAKKSAKKKER